MGKEHSCGKMGRSMKDSGKVGQNMDQGYGNQKKEIAISVNGTTEKCKDTEFTSVQMDRDMKVIFIIF